MDELVAEADVVVTGVGDCAGCCSCSIADAVMLEQRGVPVAALCTTEFVTAAALAAASAGAPGYGVAVIPHPLGSCTADELAARADGIAGRVVELLSAGAAAAGAAGWPARASRPAPPPPPVPGRAGSGRRGGRGGCHRRGPGPGAGLRPPAQRARRRVVLADVAGRWPPSRPRRSRADGGRAEGVALDVTDEDSVADVFGAVAKEQGAVVGLVNNAGGAFIPPADIEDMAYADFLRVLAVNAGGTWLCSRAVVPGMKDHGRGKIVNISSTCFSKGYPTGMVPYIAAKGGVVGLTRALARELGPHRSRSTRWRRATRRSPPAAV